jgi:hypothetical protein
MHIRSFFAPVILALLAVSLQAQPSSCQRPPFIAKLVQSNALQSLRRIPDVQRNYNALRGLCVDLIHFEEGPYEWKMLLVTHPKAPRGPFWFLPHDNEQSAFDAAVYATRKYGGGFLAVVAHDQRYVKGQDPNRNFGTNAATARNCTQQHQPAPHYANTIFRIIDTFRAPSMPYQSLHNYTNGGGISIL